MGLKNYQTKDSFGAQLEYPNYKGRKLGLRIPGQISVARNFLWDFLYTSGTLIRP